MQNNPSYLIRNWKGPADEGNPQNWPLRGKLIITGTYSMMGLCFAVSGSICTAISATLEQDYEVSYTVSTLSVAFFNLGSSVGSLLWGPLSERYGRRSPLLLAFLGYILFHIPTATASKLSMIIVSRFLEGLFGIAPVIIAGGALYDVWLKQSRGVAILAFLACNFIGLTTGPVVGACIISSSLEWRWVEWTTMLMALMVFPVAVLFVPETYHLVIFQNRARDLRFLQKNWTYHAELDEERVGWKEVFKRHLQRPLVMLITEAPLFLISLYLMFVYGLLFLFCESYPIVFMETRGWSQPVAALPFLIVAFGVALAGGILLAWDAYYPCNGSQRLVQMISGGVTLTTGLFWFAATSDSQFDWLPQACAGVFIGCGIFMIFLAGLSYVLDHYSRYANSAVAATNVTRNLAAAIASVVGKSVYQGVGVNWASAVFGFISMALIVIPIFLLRRERKKELVVTGSEDISIGETTHHSEIPRTSASQSKI